MSGELWEQRYDQMKEVIRQLVQFAQHDPTCMRKPATIHQGGYGEPTPSSCTCGLRRLFDEIDELVPD